MKIYNEEDHFFKKKWLEKHFLEIKKRAGNRYTPKLNIDLPIAEIFDGISRTENFYNSIRKHHGKLSRQFSRVTQKYQNKDIQNVYKIGAIEISKISKLLACLIKYNVNQIPWKEINKQSNKSIKALRELSNKLSEEKDKAEKQTPEERIKKQHSDAERFRSDIHYLYETQRELRYFEELSSSVKAKLSNTPFLILKGMAGTGKTHLLCDVIQNRIKKNSPLPATLIFGEWFSTGDYPFVQIIKQLGLKKNKHQFLRLLNKAGKQSGCRTILVIDALNETKQRRFWKRNLENVVNDLRKYPNIALVVSVRTGFEREVLTNRIKKIFIHEEHRGFEFREWEAVNKFFKEFKLPLPEIPLLMPEFQNPLFLLIFCKAFQNRAKKNQQKQIFRGHEGATYIFESFVDNVSKKISDQFKIPNGAGKNIWDTIIEKIAAEMVDKNDDRIIEAQMLAIVKNAYPSIKHNNLIRELERNLLIVKVPRYSKEKSDYDGFDYRFPFQKFSDHLIGRYLFKKYEQEFGKLNKNFKTAKKFFSKRRKLGKFLASSWNRGLIEAISIQCPEHLKGYELVEILPYLKGSHIAQEAFIESLIWRKPTAFSEDAKNTLTYINAEISRTESGRYNLLNAFIAVAPVPNHPFNSIFLHQHLCKFSMAERDSWWSIFLHYQNGEKGAVDRLIEWGWSAQEKKHLSNEAIYLCCLALCWFLTSSNRFLRDKTTKALVVLLTNRLPVVLDLFKKFKEINDFYILERLYAVAYGCSIRSKSDKKGLETLSQWIYDEIFLKGNPPAHILLRDYARGVIEVALSEKIKIRIDRKNIVPPYLSKWPEKIPSEKLLKRKYYPEDLFQKKTQDRGYLDIWSSVMYNTSSLADFGNYVINSAVGHWSGRKINNPSIQRKNLFKRFKSDLTKRQSSLLEKLTSPLYDINLLKLILCQEAQTGDSEKKKIEIKISNEKKVVLTNFEKSLSLKKRKFFKREIKPFLTDRGDIADSLENFDTGVAQRWIFNRVIQLGWSQKLHGEFDKNLNYHRAGRSEHKPERIGKKYQWLAFHELLARISDNYEFKGESWVDRVEKYNGPWQLSIRDIDPSCTLKVLPDETSKDLPAFKSNEIINQYDEWDKKNSNSEWLKNAQDLPDPKKSIEFIDEQGNFWIALEGYSHWQENPPPEEEKYSVPTKTIWYMVKSYLVSVHEKNKIFGWAKQQSFMGKWMPESHEFYNVYLGEYPNASAFLHHYIPYFHHDGWTNKVRDKEIPAKILVADDQYLSSGSSIDCSTNEAIHIKLPAKFIIDEMGITQKYIDGRFFDENDLLVAFDPRVFDANMPKCVLIRKNSLVDFLKQKNLSLFWTLLGEKHLIGGDSIRQSLGWLEINGAYTLNDNNKIVGQKKWQFKNNR